jgi:hypothetical protein
MIQQQRRFISKTIAALILVIAELADPSAHAGKTLSDKLEDQYFSTLNGWVKRGGKVSEYPKVVLETCQKLVMASASASEAITFTTVKKEQFDYRVNVCGKTTVHRVYPQPEFANPDTVQKICDDHDVTLLKKLCRYGGLR